MILVRMEKIEWNDTSYKHHLVQDQDQNQEQNQNQHQEYLSPF